MLLPACSGKIADTSGITRLYAIENWLLDSRERVWGSPPDGRITFSEVRRVVKFLRGTAVCDYGAIAKAYRSLKWIIMQMIRRGWAWISGAPEHTRTDEIVLTAYNIHELIDWIPPRSDGRIATSFNPRIAKLDEAVNLFVEV